MELDLVVRGGTVVTDAGIARADVGITGGHIVALGIDLPRAPREIDARGKLVMPGGIDSHVHLAEESPVGGKPADRCPDDGPSLRSRRMGDYDLVIRGGTVATASDVARADIGVKDGRITALGEKLGGAPHEIDAAGKLVLPGGIDSHVHIDQVSSTKVYTADDFLTGTRSALAGGTTTVIPFAAQHRGQSLRQVVRDYHAKAEGKALTDYAFHLIVSDPTEQVLGQELPALIRDGYTSFKVYTTYDALKLSDRQMLEILTLARREGAMVMVHAENHDMIQWLSDKLTDEGKTAPKYHAVAHAPIAEREATERVIALAELADAPVLIVHVSGREAIERIRAAQARGLRVLAETCPQYLYLTQDDLDKPGFEGAMCMCSPPPRDAANQEFVWHGLMSGVFQVFSSDHAPYRYNDPEGKMKHGTDASFKKVPNGVPGIGARLPLLFSGGVRTGRLDVTQFVALAATNHAKIYGLYPRKGTIAVGADADIAIWDPDREVTITLKDLHDNMDYTPYEGRRVTGWPETVISRGEIVCHRGEIRAAPGRGRFLACATPEVARPGRGILRGAHPGLGLSGVPF